VSSSTNRSVSERLYEYSAVLEQQEANPFRVKAYQRAAATVEGLDEDIGEIYERGGTESLVALPNIGRGIASAIAELLQTGRLTRLERLRGALEPDKLFQVVPGIGPKLAGRIHDQLGIDTLEALELAAHDGRLETVTGISQRRARMIRASLQSLLASQRPAFHRDLAHGPDVGLLLDLDRAYREKAERGELPKIAPKRFNPEHEAWLPVMHENAGNWHFTVLFSNTARAHELGRTADWVVIYFYDDHHEEGQHTVVTETSGPLVGERVVRGRETECRAYYS
jgi:putative hydrolase